MLPTYAVLRTHLSQIIAEKTEQGHVTTGLPERLAALPDSYDALWAFAVEVSRLPLRTDWEFVEPDDLAEIQKESDPSRPLGRIAAVPDAAARVETGFLSSVCGCILGKPFEIHGTLAELRTALESNHDWPLRDYVSEKIRSALPRPFHPSWPETLRENIQYAAPDDDINYTLMGMLILEQFGLNFTRVNVRNLWLHHLPILTTFGPERTTLLNAGVEGRYGPQGEEVFRRWVSILNPGEEKCGALIRADAYGYACPGKPALASELAWRDASFTHRRTGIYGTMFVAAAIAVAQTHPADPMEIFHVALQFVPQRSRFAAVVRECLDHITSATDWLDGYQRVHRKYAKYGHCLIYQEIGTLINSLRFAKDIPDGFCIQVMQGNDTDSFGATSGSILGCYFGPDGKLALNRWLAPFHDDLHTALAWFYERSINAVARRMGALTRLTV